MNTAVALKARIEKLGGQVRVIDGRLQVQATKGRVTLELRDALKASKPELIELLSRRYPDSDASRTATLRCRAPGA